MGIVDSPQFQQQMIPQSSGTPPVKTAAVTPSSRGEGE
jgi:hypothetical protein